MKRPGRVGWLIADIWLGADRLLKARFIADGAPPYSVHHHVNMMERVIVEEVVPAPSISSRPNTSSPPRAPAAGIHGGHQGESCCFVSLVTQAHRFGCTWELFDEMLKWGMLPSLVVHNTLSDACWYQGVVAKAQELWDRMVATQRSAICT